MRGFWTTSQYAPIREYALINQMRLLTRFYGIHAETQERIVYWVHDEILFCYIPTPFLYQKKLCNYAVCIIIIIGTKGHHAVATSSPHIFLLAAGTAVRSLSAGQTPLEWKLSV